MSRFYSRSISGHRSIAFLADQRSRTSPQESPLRKIPLTIASTADTATLQATTDNDLATTLWESVSGPGIVSIDTPSSTTTTATFDTAGSYTLHLNASTSDVTTFRAQIVNVTTQASEDNFDSYLDQFSLTGDDRLAGADPDGDGLANLNEYAFGGDPTEADEENLEPTSTIGSDTLDITYRQLTGSEATGTVGVDYTIAGIEYAVVIGDDLTYELIPSAVQQIGSAVDNGDGTETVTVRITPPTPTRTFSRVRISEVE